MSTESTDYTDCEGIFMKHYRRLSFIFCILLAAASCVLPVQALDYTEAALERQALPVESNACEGWPEGPLVTARAAILMDADTGVVLYSKNIHEQLYPASTTKLMTALLAIENCDLTEEVVMTNSALASVPSDGSRMGIKIGEKLTMEQALYALLVQSANEVAYAIGEHISVSERAFAEKMTNRAIELGCKNTVFKNASGLNNDDHLTTAYDLALIGREFFSHEFLAQAASTTSYKLSAEEGVHGAYNMSTKNLLYKGKEYEYPYLIGSKTGYLSVAGQTLVSCAEKDGMRLICVVLFEDNPYQYIDTVSLFDYGFENFSYLELSAGILEHFEDDGAFLIEDTPKLVVPNGILLTDLTKEMDTTDAAAGYVRIHYKYHDASVGDITISKNSGFIPPDTTDSSHPIYINVIYLVAILLGFTVALNILVYLTNALRQLNITPSGPKRRRPRRKFSAKGNDRW